MILIIALAVKPVDNNLITTLMHLSAYLFCVLVFIKILWLSLLAVTIIKSRTHDKAVAKSLNIWLLTLNHVSLLRGSSEVEWSELPYNCGAFSNHRRRVVGQVMAECVSINGCANDNIIIIRACCNSESCLREM